MQSTAIWVTAIATGVLALVTTYYAFLVYHQISLTNKQLKWQTRPKLSVRIFNKDRKYFMRLVNIGEIPITNIKLSYCFKLFLDKDYSGKYRTISEEYLPAGTYVDKSLSCYDVSSVCFSVRFDNCTAIDRKEICLQVAKAYFHKDAYNKLED